MQQMHDAVIVGGGPAGASCALWLARLGLSPLLVEASARLGGLGNDNPFTDDWIATPRTVSLLHALYATRGVPVHATWIAPADVGVKRIDHEGAFRASNSALWPRIAEVLEADA